MTTITCPNCNLKGHRYTTCTVPLKPRLAIRKAGHKSNCQLPGNMDMHAAPSSPSATPPQPALPRQAPFVAPRQAPATAPRQAPFTAPRQDPAATPPCQAQAAAPPQAQAAAPCRNIQAAPRQKLTSMRGQGRMHYTERRLYSYFTASNGQGEHEEEDNYLGLKFGCNEKSL